MKKIQFAKNFGKYNETIWINSRGRFEIGRFNGNKEETIAKLLEEYSGNELKNCLLKLEECQKGHTFYQYFANDEDWRIRAAVASAGYCLEKLANDDVIEVICEVVSQGYDLERFLNHSHWAVRGHVASKGYRLDKLISDKDNFVRAVVAQQNYGLEKLANDENEFVHIIARKQLKKLDNKNI